MLLRSMHNPKNVFLPANEEINCTFLNDKLSADEIRFLKETIIPKSILSKLRLKEIFYSKRKTPKLKRTSAKDVRRGTAKKALQGAIGIINNCPEFTNKEVFIKFIRLYDVEDVNNTLVPAAEWCHMIALSLSADQENAMSQDNLFAATAMVNTKMINFEESARRLAYQGNYSIKVETSFATFINTPILAELTQRLIVTDTKGKSQTFEQKINPFEITKVTQSNSVHDPYFVYKFIKKNMLRHDLKQKERDKQ